MTESEWEMKKTFEFTTTYIHGICDLLRDATVDIQYDYLELMCPSDLVLLSGSRSTGLLDDVRCATIRTWKSRAQRYEMEVSYLPIKRRTPCGALMTTGQSASTNPPCHPCQAQCCSPLSDDSLSKQHNNQAQPPIRIRRLAHELFERRRERHRSPMQHYISQDRVAAAGEQGREQAAQGRTEGLWRTCAWIPGQPERYDEFLSMSLFQKEKLGVVWKVVV